MNPIREAITYGPDIRKYVVQAHRNTYSVLSPADLTDGACFGREVICVCRNRERAEEIAKLFNDREDYYEACEAAYNDEQASKEGGPG